MFAALLEVEEELDGQVAQNRPKKYLDEKALALSR